MCEWCASDRMGMIELLHKRDPGGLTRTMTFKRSLQTKREILMHPRFALPLRCHSQRTSSNEFKRPSRWSPFMLPDSWNIQINQFHGNISGNICSNYFAWNLHSQIWRFELSESLRGNNQDKKHWWRHCSLKTPPVWQFFSKCSSATGFRRWLFSLICFENRTGWRSRHRGINWRNITKHELVIQQDRLVGKVPLAPQWWGGRLDVPNCSNPGTNCLEKTQCSRFLVSDVVLVICCHSGGVHVRWMWPLGWPRRSGSF